ncbi:MAG: SLC13 family permease [Planctomycetaceae bacterium]
MSGVDVDCRKERLARFSGLGAGVLFLLVLALPTPEGLTPEGHRLGAVTLLMAGLWLSQAIPIAATALLPLALYPLLAIQSADEVSGSYLDSNVFLFLGGFVLAAAIEKWNLHRRLALHIVAIVGCSSKRIVLGFMIATAFLSMWISNTASTMLMLPISLALLAALADVTRDESASSSDGESPAIQGLGVALLLGIAYASSLGGLSTTVGTPTNVQFLSIWNDPVPAVDGKSLVEAYGTISMGSWMAAFVPLGLVMLVAAWLVLTWGVPHLPGAERLGRSFFRDRLRSLGKPSRSERVVLFLFAATAALWMTRAPLKFGDVTLFAGWGKPLTNWLVTHIGASEGFAKKLPIHDSTIAMLTAILLFAIPGDPDPDGRPRRLMDWETAHHRLPWGILLLIGGGLAMAGAFQSTGLSKWVGQSLFTQAEGLPLVVLVAGVCLLMTFLTEFTTNVATVSTLVPIMIQGAIFLGVDPRLIAIPATVSASCAFMLPIATPPNAIVFGSGKITMPQMMRAGLWLNLIGVGLTTLATFALLKPLLGL